MQFLCFFFIKFDKKFAKSKKIMYNTSRRLCKNKEGMLMRKYIVAIISILCITIILSSFVCKSNAVGLEVLDDPDKYIQSNEDNSKAINIANIVVWVVRTFGEAIAVVMLLLIGIKYIFASVEQKAEYKQTMIPYKIGAVLIFSGAALTNVIYEAFK